LKKSFAAIALAGSITLIGAGPAMANTPYPAPTTSGTVSDGTVAPGETFTFSGSGFLAGEAISVTVTLTRAPQASGGAFSGGASMAVPAKINLPLAPQTFATTADANGNFAFPVSISEAGTYALTATGLTSGKTVNASVTVAGATVATNGGVSTSGSAAELADTGSDASLLLWGAAGIGALGLGAAGVIISRRRNKAVA
jgi:LPXTG-motif cell wall-anchored protein